MGSNVCVVPCNRPDQFAQFVEAWDPGGANHGGWDELILVEDGPKKTIPTDARVAAHYSWAEIEAECGADHWVFSRRDSAVRAFGFLMAWRRGAAAVLTLDDDVRPPADGYPAGTLFAAHLAAVRTQSKWVPSVPGVRTRGLPYYDPGVLGGVQANAGLWRNVADYDAVQTLAAQAAGRPVGREYFVPPAGSRVVPRGQYTPVCGMNLCFLRAALPCFYFPLMGEGQSYRRMDDIWAGVIAKKVFDHLGWRLAVGEPVVEHVRASDPLVNLVKEAPGIAFNETFWRHVDAARLPREAGPPAPPAALAAVDALGAHLAAVSKTADDEYLHRLGRALRTWVRLLRAAPAPPVTGKAAKKKGRA